jgi:hypothetical protein
MEDDRTYLMRRLDEERQAVEQAATPESRHAHQQLLRRYQQALETSRGTRVA